MVLIFSNRHISCVAKFRQSLAYSDKICGRSKFCFHFDWYPGRETDELLNHFWKRFTICNRPVSSMDSVCEISLSSQFPPARNSASTSEFIVVSAILCVLPIIHFTDEDINQKISKRKQDTDRRLCCGCDLDSRTKSFAHTRSPQRNCRFNLEFLAFQCLCVDYRCDLQVHSRHIRNGKKSLLTTEHQVLAALDSFSLCFLRVSNSVFIFGFELLSICLDWPFWSSSFSPIKLFTHLLLFSFL